MPVDGYTSVTLRTNLVEKIKEFLNEHPEHGYKGVADFVTDAVREKLIELGAMKIDQENIQQPQEVEA